MCFFAFNKVHLHYPARQGDSGVNPLVGLLFCVRRTRRIRSRPCWGCFRARLRVKMLHLKKCLFLSCSCPILRFIMKSFEVFLPNLKLSVLSILSSRGTWDNDFDFRKTRGRKVCASQGQKTTRREEGILKGRISDGNVDFFCLRLDAVIYCISFESSFCWLKIWTQFHILSIPIKDSTKVFSARSWISFQKWLQRRRPWDTSPPFLGPTTSQFRKQLSHSGSCEPRTPWNHWKIRIDSCSGLGHKN